MSKLPNPANFESRHDKIHTAATIGDTTDTSAKIWVRTFIEGDWKLLMSPTPLEEIETLAQNADFPNAEQCVTYNCKVFEGQTFRSTGQTHTFLCTNLMPGTTYHYYLIAKGSTHSNLERKVEFGAEVPHTFKTDKDEITDVTFGFYSCHDPFGHRTLSEGLWPHLLEQLENHRANFVIGGGDQVYCDTHGRKGEVANNRHKPQITDLWDWLKKHKKALANKFNFSANSTPSDLNTADMLKYLKELYRAYYRIYWKCPPMLDVYRSFPQYMIWDDHEIMDGWGSLTKKERADKLDHLFQWDNSELNEAVCQLAFKAAKEVYHEFQHSHNPNTNSEVWDYGFVKGDVGFYVLDMRGHHDVERADGYCLLGQAQHARLDAWLTQCEAENIRSVFIVSPVPVVHWNDSVMNRADLVLALFGAKDDALDEWGHDDNVAERDILLGRLSDFSDTNNIPVTFLSGDVHSASVFKFNFPDKPKAQLTSITSSAISRKPAPEIAEKLIEKTGKLYKHPSATIEQLYFMSGYNNFLMVNVNTDDTPCHVGVTLHFGEPKYEFTKQKSIKIV